MVNSWAVRIHVDGMGDNGVDRLRELLRDVGSSDGYVFALETKANREHVQGWVRTELSQQTFRARIKRMFPGVVGNKGYSVRVVRDFDAYSDYVLKGTPTDVATVVAHHCVQMSDEYLAAAHRRYWSKHGSKSSSKTAIVEEVFCWANSFAEAPDRRSIVERVCDVISGRNKPLMVPYVKGVVNSVMYKLDGTEKNRLIEYITDSY